MLTTFGDLAQAVQSQRQSTLLKSTAARLTTELTTGRSADPGKRLFGDFGPLAEISRALNTLDTFKTTNAEAARFTGTMQSVLDQIRSLGGDSAQTLLQAGSSGATAFVDVGGAAARDALKNAQPEVMRAAQKGIIHKNAASRKISRLSHRVKALG